MSKKHEGLEKKCERQTLFITLNNCLLTSDSFSLFSDMLVYRYPVSTC